ncbi:glycosyltransferase [Flavobacterium crassostreae]|uniref:Spore protein YkvP/CgeB glycosyl transferase-like domain-containing protein n=1 Tax=Flavobacterium crassostreae TaxID=1763534 RepID=A0A1B9E3D7_9FLAO|nr:glycosyltransferase [Flavobacterium crassostreae]OCB76464.1 hypothetical protein LPBF_05865 [Flavobacterium crassostreae]
MRILLVGEYSRFHNSLKEGLVSLGHQVVIIGDNDFKNYPLDISVYAKTCKEHYWLNKIRQVIFKLSKIDVAQIEVAYRFFKNRKKLVGFDVVQLINEYPLQSTVFLEKKMIAYLFKNNKKAFLVSCGDDYISVKHMLEGHFKYSVLTPCLANPKLDHCKYTLRYATKSFKKLHHYVYQNILAVIPADMDYAIPLKNHPQATPLIPHPINTALNQYSPLHIEDTIHIFHGINTVNYYKKGNDYFEKALAIIAQKYPNQVTITTTRSVAYSQYIQRYNQCHILLDQVFSYDQGFNALEAMAKGKVVFTGAETEFTEHFNLTQKVCINALPEVDYLVDQLSYLIENPHEIHAISQRARAFIEQEHDCIKVAQKYLTTWEQYPLNPVLNRPA